MHPTMRFGAVAALAFWFFGFVVCQAQCLAQSRSCHSSLPIDGHHEGAASEAPCHSHNDEDTSGNGGDCCCSVQLISQGSNSIELNLVQVLSITAIFPEMLPLYSEPSLSKVIVQGQDDWLDWTLNPVLYLGPGNRSLAPPSSSYTL